MSSEFRWPDVDVIVAVRNEAALVDGKIEDVLAQEYPGRVRLIVVDGGSTDGTVARLTAAAARRPQLDARYTRLASKCAQLNEALASSRAPWILVSDADARLPPRTLRTLVAAGAVPDVAVVGTPLTPQTPHPLDAWHWRVVNRLRRLETRLGTTGLVVAPCYLFRRALIDRFPEDAAADDVFVACRAAEQGLRIALVELDVREMRTAATGRGWLRHKIRRTHAYLREVVRFLPRALRMPWPMNVVFLWRAMALTAAPAAALLLAAAAVVRLELPTLGLLAAGMITAGAVSLSRPRRESHLLHAIRGATLPAWWLVIAVAALAIAPFVRVNASYVRPAPRAGASEAC